RWVHPEDRDQVTTAMAQIGQPGVSSASFEARFRARDPAHDPAHDRSASTTASATPWRWLHWSLRRDADNDAARPLLYAVARDVTERRNAELALAAETAF